MSCNLGTSPLLKRVVIIYIYNYIFNDIYIYIFICGIIFWHSFLAFYLASILTFFSGILSGISSEFLCGWGPAGNTLIRSSRLRSGREHSDLELAVEVRRGTLWSRGCCWGPAGNTVIERLLLGSGGEHCDLKLAVEVRRGKEEGGRRKEEARKPGRRKEEGGRRKEEGRGRAGWHKILTTLTWQVGKNLKTNLLSETAAFVLMTNSPDGIDHLVLDGW